MLFIKSFEVYITKKHRIPFLFNVVQSVYQLFSLCTFICSTLKICCCCRQIVLRGIFPHCPFCGESRCQLCHAFIVVLFICVDLDKFTTGKIYSVVAYLWTFIGQTDYLPDLMESLGSIKDLNARFSQDEKSLNQQVI